MVSPDVYWMGGKSLRVSRSELHGTIRQKLVSCMREALGSAPCGIVFVKGGEESSFYTTDTETDFRQESYFHYLFGVEEPNWYGAVDLNTGKSMLFIPRLPDSYATWMGPIKGPQDFQAKYAVDAVHYQEDLPSVLAALKPPCLHVLSGTNSDSGTPATPASFPGLEAIPQETDTLFETLNECRVFKTPQELEVLQYANQVAAAAHVELMRSCRPGMMEYELSSLFMHLCYSKGGAKHWAYGPISASGANSAILHYVSNDKEIQDGELLLSDMGCQYHHYISDITITFPTNGRFTPTQATIYETVLKAHQTVISTIKPGVSWPDMHRLANRIILEGLLELGVVRGSLDDLMAHHIGALFMPHGLGHFFGVDTHDVGGYPRGGPPRIQEPGLNRLRTARVLQEGMCITVEPGCYFVGAILKPALEDQLLGSFLVRDKVEALLNFGGVRIEDDVVVTAGGAQSLTAGLVPRTVQEIEEVMAGGSWPRC